MLPGPVPDRAFFSPAARGGARACINPAHRAAAPRRIRARAAPPAKSGNRAEHQVPQGFAACDAAVAR
jgi:hypothetical protein